MDLWLRTIPAPSIFFEVCGKFFYTLSYAYLGSFLFYFINVHCERQREKIKLYQHIGYHFHSLIFDGEKIFCDMASKRGLNIKFENITKEDVKTICFYTYPLSESTIMRMDKEAFLNWIEYWEYMSARIHHSLELIQIQMKYLDVDCIELITRFTDSQIFKSIDLLVYFYRNGLLNDMNSVQGLEISFVSFMELLKDAELYYNKEFRYYLEEK